MFVARGRTDLRDFVSEVLKQGVLTVYTYRLVELVLSFPFGGGRREGVFRGLSFLIVSKRPYDRYVESASIF